MSRPASSTAVIVMAKQPHPGRTKTRLVPPLTHELAAELAECFLLDALDIARSVPGATPLVAVWPPESAGYFASIAADVGQIAQVGASLDERLDHVLCTGLAMGFGAVVAINADSPTLPVRLVTAAFDALAGADVDVVLGPAEDGGYYLIGWTRPHSGLVRGVAMSTPTVLHETLARARRAGVRVRLLDEWYDVDGPDDLARVRAELADAGDVAVHTAGLLARHAEARW